MGDATVTDKPKRGSGRLPPNLTVPQVGAQQRVAHRQQQRNVATWLERMAAIANKNPDKRGAQTKKPQ
jgi:hypothetical protein